MGAALENGSSVAVVGGGPAGSLCAYFLRTFASRMDLDLRVDVYEPRDFTRSGPAGCNMCGGIVSESLVQALAVEGIELPQNVVQRGIDSYVLHTETESLRIATPLAEKRIATVQRGGGPRGAADRSWGGLDGYLLGLAREHGARVVSDRVRRLEWHEGRPTVVLSSTSQTYDLLVGAVGVNSNGVRMFESLGLASKPCETTRTFITEIARGDGDVIGAQFQSAVHLFLLDDPRLDCAAIVPKGNFWTVCLLGREIDGEFVERFFRSEAVRRLFGAKISTGGCSCWPRINVRETVTPFLDRVVLVGDCGVTRLYKDGIGAAYRTAKAVARTAIFSGVSAADFQRHYWPVYRGLAVDNRFGRLIFAVVRRIKAISPLLRAVLRMSEKEQESPGADRAMSIVLWDMFTGSASYRDVFRRTLEPRFLARFLRETVGSLGGGRPLKTERCSMVEGGLGRQYRDGDLICQQGEVGDRMYVIQSGQAVVLREQDGVEEIVGVLGSGDVFGEMAIFERQPRSATVRAKGPARVLTLDKHAFLRQVHEDPSLAYRMLQQMSNRIRKLNGEVSWLLSHAGEDSESSG